MLKISLQILNTNFIPSLRATPNSVIIVSLIQTLNIYFLGGFLLHANFWNYSVYGNLQIRNPLNIYQFKFNNKKTTIYSHENSRTTSLTWLYYLKHTIFKLWSYFKPFSRINVCWVGQISINILNYIYAQTTGKRKR